MGRRLVLGVPAMLLLGLALATPVLAHGDHDARPIARGLRAGPYSISIWQVYPDGGMTMAQHLIVMFDGLPATPAAARVDLVVNGERQEVFPSTTTRNGLETSEGVDVFDVIALTVADEAGAWNLDPLIVQPPPTSVLPMTELVYLSIALTAATALWVARRAARAWRQPAISAS
jgi:hypothetical protein